jgi:hypothetical protein
MQVTDGVEGAYDFIRLNIQFENLTGDLVIIAYRAHTSYVVDEFKNTYYCCSAKGATDTSVTGMGINQDKITDPQFKLEKHQIDNVTFQVSGHRNGHEESPYFHYDVTVEEMDPHNPHRLLRQYPLYFGDFTATWRSPHSKGMPH